MTNALDVGTTKVMAAGEVPAASVRFARERNAFLDLRKTDSTRTMLGRLGVRFEEPNGRILVLGNEAFDLAHVFEREARRPMRDGGLSPGEEHGIEVVEALVRRVLGPARAPGSACGFSVPAGPVDSGLDVLYFQGAVEGMVRELGYRPVPVGEGMAVVLAELEEADFTGIGVSCGGGMWNVAVAYRGLSVAAFSIARGGDWIDRESARALGTTAVEVCAIKEAGIDLLQPRGRVQEAIAIYYRHLVRYVVGRIAARLEELGMSPTFGQPLAVVLAGGTAMPAGFAEVVREELMARPWPVEVAGVQRVGDPLTSVVRGCLRALTFCAAEPVVSRT